MMKPACKDCWDPVDRDGAEVCDWCAMTPQQRKTFMRKVYFRTAILLAAWGALMFWLAARGAHT